MFRKSLYLAGMLAGALLWAAAAQAAPGQVTQHVNLRSGPGTSYPVITQIPAGAVVDINNCSGWCEVTYAGRDGFVNASFIAAARSNSAPYYAYDPAPYYDYEPGLYNDFYDYGGIGYGLDNHYHFGGHGHFGGGYGHGWGGHGWSGGHGMWVGGGLGAGHGFGGHGFGGFGGRGHR